MRLDKIFIGLFSALCACMCACSGENDGVAGTVTDTGNTIATGIVTRSDGSPAVSALVRIAREPVVGDSLAKIYPSMGK